VTTEVGHHHHVSPKDLTSVEAHLADILDSIRPLPPTQLGITEAEGCVLAEDVTASRPLPPFDNSAMDGYALIASDVAGASKDSPVTLRVSGEVAAGDTGAYAVTPGSALIITTGAKLPGGADAVVPVEDTDGGVARVAIGTAVEPGHAVRFSGGDARQGEVLLPRGTRLGPLQIAVLAASGHARAEVYPGPGSWFSRPATSWSSPVTRSRRGRSGTPTASCSPRRPGRPGAWPSATVRSPTTR
jgi:molybdopterin molybdotransferase